MGAHKSMARDESGRTREYRTSQGHQARGRGHPPRLGRWEAFSSADETIWPAVLLGHSAQLSPDCRGRGPQSQRCRTSGPLESREGCGGRLWGWCGCCVNISLGAARTPREDRGSPHPTCPPPLLHQARSGDSGVPWGSSSPASWPGHVTALGPSSKTPSPAPASHSGHPRPRPAHL